MPAVVAGLLLMQQIEAFLYREAELLDERRCDEWLDLLTEDTRYWMPMRRNAPRDELDRELLGPLCSPGHVGLANLVLVVIETRRGRWLGVYPPYACRAAS